jgi:hypothetical protein
MAQHTLEEKFLRHAVPVIQMEQDRKIAQHVMAVQQVQRLQMI